MGRRGSLSLVLYCHALVVWVAGAGNVHLAPTILFICFVPFHFNSLTLCHWFPIHGVVLLDTIDRANPAM